MKGIKLCGECGNYDYKKHRCRIGCKDDSDAQAPFYCDCPLPDVVPKSEVFLASSDSMKMLIECHGYALTHDEDVKRDVAMEIFAEIEKLLHSLETPINKYWVLLPNELAELKNKYTGEKECPNCRYFVGCECFDGKTCDEYEEKKE